MAIIGLVMALITYWEDIWNWFKKTFPVLDTLSKKFNKFGGFMNAIVTGAKAVAAAVVNWLINPFKTFADVVGKILKGDFTGAWQAALDGIKNQFKGTADAFKNEVVKGFARGQEEMTRKQAAEEDKRLTHHNNMITKQKNKDGTYTKEYIKDTQKMYDNRKKMYKKGSDEYNKVLEDEAKFHQQVEDAKTAATEKATKARTAAAKKAAADAKKDAKEEEKAEKERQELYKKTDETIKNIDKLIEDTTKKQLKLSDDAYKENVKRYVEYSQKYGEEYANMVMYADKTSKKISEVEGLLAEMGNDLTISEQVMLQGYLKSLQDDMDYFTNKIVSDAAHITGTIDKTNYFIAHRKEIAINQIAMEALKIKEQYQKEIKDLTDYIAKLEETAKKQSGSVLDETKAKIKEAQEAVKAAQKSMVTELGTYAQEPIFVPVDVDLKNVSDRYNQLNNDMGGKITFTLNQVMDSIFGVKGAIEQIYKSAEKKGGDALFETFRDLGNILGMARGETEEELNQLQEFLDIITDGRPFSEKAKEIQDYISGTTVNISRFGTFSKQATEKLKDIDKEAEKAFQDSYNSFVAKQDKLITYNDKVIKRFQDATRDIKFEPVMKDDALSGLFKGQIMDLDKTRDRYDKLRNAYKEYQNVLKVGSKERMEYENAWNQKLAASARNVEHIKKLYGESSDEYKNAVRDYELLTKDKEKADAAYAIEYEKVTKQIEDISKKQADLMYDYIQSIADRVADITKQIQENVVAPIFDGLGDLFAFQLEEAQEALEEIEKLYDKAVDARQESADRMKEINDELRNDDGANKEALQQRLAEEEVLLVQREEAERALEKEKARREEEVKKKEAQQRKLELSQKLIEGIANTALGATAALKYGFPMGPIFAAIITAFGALQTAIIAKQLAKIKYERGGKVGENGISRSHRQGGHRVEDTNIEVEGGEWVINRKSSSKYDTLLKAINDDNLGLVRKQVEIIRERRIAGNGIRKFATGGQINTLTATRAVEDNNQIQAITDLIRQIDFQPTVSVVDINKTNKNLTRVQDLSGKVKS